MYIVYYNKYEKTNLDKCYLTFILDKYIRLQLANDSRSDNYSGFLPLSVHRRCCRYIKYFSSVYPNEIR